MDRSGDWRWHDIVAEFSASWFSKRMSALFLNFSRQKISNPIESKNSKIYPSDPKKVFECSKLRSAKNCDKYIMRGFIFLGTRHVRCE